MTRGDATTPDTETVEQLVEAFWKHGPAFHVVESMITCVFRIWTKLRMHHAAMAGLWLQLT
jgi:hypothetical protein